MYYALFFLGTSKYVICITPTHTCGTSSLKCSLRLRGYQILNPDKENLANFLPGEEKWEKVRSVKIWQIMKRRLKKYENLVNFEKEI